MEALEDPAAVSGYTLELINYLARLNGFLMMWQPRRSNRAAQGCGVP